MAQPRVEVRVVERAKVSFLKGHRKDADRADDVWRALVAMRPTLELDPFVGDAIMRSRWPRGYQHLPTLFRIALPHGFRALYSVLVLPNTRRVVSIEWLGDHKEYDRLFGYSTS